MSDPAVGGALMPAGSGSMWANGGPRFGDMVWGKVKSHPWWPGHIYSINLTDDDEVHRGRRDGLILVAFFGDSSYGWFEPHELVPFEEHFTEKAAQGGSTRSSFAAAVAEAVDEVARRSALALLCPCRKPGAFRTHPGDSSFLLVDVPGFDSDADYHPDQIQAARERFVPRKALDYLLDAAVTQRDAAEAAARTLPGIEMAGMFAAYRRAVFASRDDTYAEAFGVDPQRVLDAEKEAAAQRARARPLKGARRTPDQATPTPGRRRGGAGGAAARLMEKIVPGASAMKAKASKKDQYLLKRRDAPEPAHRPPLPDAPPPAPAPAMDDGPPGFPPSEDPPTPPLPGSSIADEEEFMLQRRAPVVELPPAAQATEAATAASAVAATDAAPKKAAKAKKPRKTQREEAAAASAAAAAGETKKKKKKKKISNLGAAAGSGKPAALPDPSGIDLTQVISDVRNLPLAPFHGADRRISDASRSFILAFRSKYYKKSYENDPPEEAKKSLDKPNAAAAAADGQQPKKKKPVVARPGVGNDPTKAGVKRGPSDRQEELAVKKKAKLEKIKTLSSEKKAAGLEQKDSTVAASGAPAAQQARSIGAKEKAEMVAAGKKKEPAAAPRKTPSPTALMMKFPLKSTLPSVASLKARFARFGPLDVNGIRVYWKSHMCRVLYRFRSDAEAALRYARANAMFGQVDTQYHLREVEVEPEAAGREPPASEAPPQTQHSELRLLETAPFRPGSSGNGAPLATSRAVPARPTVGPPPKSILKKTSDEALRVKFVGEGGGSSKLEPPALAASGGGGGAAAAAAKPGAKSVGFASPQPLQLPSRTLAPPMRPAQPPLQPPRAATQQVQLPPPPALPLPYQPPRVSDYPPQHTEGPLAFSGQPSQPPPYAGPSTLPGPPPALPYLARSTSFPGQPYNPPRAGDIPPPVVPGQAQQQQQPQQGAGEEVPAWKTSKEEFKAEVWRLMTGIAKIVEPLTDKNGNFPYHLFSSQ